MWKRVAIVVLVLYVGLAVVGTARHYWIEHQAEQWRQEAERAAAATWTEGDALAWLREQGYEVLRRGEYEQSALGQTDEHGFLVAGGFYLSEGNLLLQPAWVDLSFLFDRDHKFRRVESRLMDEPPGSRR